MLHAIRENAKGVIAIIIVIFIGIPFALSGIQNYLDVGKQLGVVAVNGQEISRSEFASAYQLQRNRIEQQLGKNFDPSVFDDKEIKNAVLEQLINNRIAIQAADDMGYRIGANHLAQIIHAQQSFQREGKFDMGMYEVALRSQGMTPSSFEYLIHQDMLANQYRSGITDTLGVTQNDVDTVLKLINQKRDIGYVMIPAGDVNQSEAPSEESIKDYYTNNKNEFMQSEQVKVDYVRIKASDLAVNVTVSDEDLRKYYDENIDAFITRGEREVAHILISPEKVDDDASLEQARAKAQDLYDRIQKGESFSELAKTNSMDISSSKQGGDLGRFEKGLMGEVFEKTALSLKQGEVSQPVRTEFGFHLIKVTKLIEDKIKSFDDAKAELAAIVKNEKSLDQFYALAERLEDMSYETPDSLEAPATELGLKIMETDYFTLTGGKDIAANPKFASKAFEEEVLVQRINSAPVEISSGDVVVLRVKDHKPAEARPIEEVSAIIVKKLKAEKASSFAKSTAEKIAERIKSGEKPEVVAGDVSLKWEARSSVSRNESSVNPQIVKTAFVMGRPDEKPVVDIVAMPNGDHAVVMVNTVTDGDTTTTAEAEKLSIARMLSRSRSMDEYSALMTELRKHADVIIRDKEL